MARGQQSQPAASSSSTVPKVCAPNLFALFFVFTCFVHSIFSCRYFLTFCNPSPILSLKDNGLPHQGSWSSNDLTQSQKKRIRAICFGGLLKIASKTLPAGFADWLMAECYDADSSELVFLAGEGFQSMLIQYVVLLVFQTMVMKLSMSLMLVRSTSSMVSMVLMKGQHLLLTLYWKDWRRIRQAMMIF